MTIISTMANTGNPKRLYVTTTVPLRSALKRVVSGLVESTPFARRRKLLSQELVVNASWLMMQEMDAEELAAKIAPYVARAEAILSADVPAQKHEPAPPPLPPGEGKSVRINGLPAVDPPVTPAKRRRRS